MPRPVRYEPDQRIIYFTFTRFIPDDAKDEVNNVDSIPVIIAPDGIDFARLSSLRHPIDCPVMVVDIEPVSCLPAIPINGKRWW